MALSLSGEDPRGFSTEGVLQDPLSYVAALASTAARLSSGKIQPVSGRHHTPSPT
jgi:hypothetical protein